jgi:putative transcriptional regulator
MTQQQFADFLMISVRTLQKWEQGERGPDGASHTLLRVMEKEPEAVKRALHG